MLKTCRLHLFDSEWIKVITWKMSLNILTKGGNSEAAC